MSAGFDLFSMRSLIIRYDSVIGSIHKQRHCCQDCGIGFKELYSEQHQQHAKLHLNEEKTKDPKTKKDFTPKNQPWFMLDVSIFVYFCI
uniref:Uncharacterized protein n=1 Tax=Meloidogyne enterolobii TaxID=390850 RepID=A0A6V7WQZ2_MELEN|nr:unnamed protein product [Meloidogyne enterolobii]